MATLFIADLHLCVEEPAITAGFLRFLAGEARKADALYILGDLFEAWIGDDDPNPLHRQMAAAIKAVSDSGVPCYFIHGNRDFLLGKRFARESGMTLLPEEKVLELYGRRVLIMHGDTLCTDDAGYQAFRAKVHKPWLQMLFLALPLFVRKRIAARMRANSKEANSSKSLAIMDVNQNAVVSAMEKHQVQWLIHGHTHRPAVHELIALGVPVDQIEDMAENSAVCVPTMMPYITAFFMPRTKGDRPDVIPDGCVNFAFLGQFADTPRDTVFTTEYSVRTAMEAVYGLLGVDRGVPEVWGSVYDIRELLDSSVKLMDGKSPLEIELPGPLDMLKKPLLKAVKGTVIEKVLRDHDVIKDYMM